MSDFKLMEPTPEELVALAEKPLSKRGVRPGKHQTLIREFVASGKQNGVIYRGADAYQRAGGFTQSINSLGLQNCVDAVVRGSTLFLARLDSEENANA